MEGCDWLWSSNNLAFFCNSCNESDMGEKVFFFCKENVPLQNAALSEEL
jgi:hypothetical protein